jgi:putative FmdB family regulatory protein
MPTYDYRCNACGVRFELFQSMTEAHKKKCPECGKNKLERLIGAGAGFIFKGAGFYETDYRSPSYEEGAKAEASSQSSATPAAEAAKSDSPPDSKADSKPAPKPASKPAASAAKPSASPAAKSRGKPANPPRSAPKPTKGSAAPRRGRSKS